MVGNYDGEDFLGEITCCDGNDQFEVSVIHNSSNHWKWPKTINKILYARDDSTNHQSSQTSRTLWTVFVLSTVAQ